MAHILKAITGNAVCYLGGSQPLVRIHMKHFGHNVLTQY